MAKNKMKNTIVEMELSDGSKVKLTLAYRFLIQLSAKNRKAYDAYNAVWNKKEEKREEIDNVRILYTGYLCASLQEGTFDAAMTWDEFVDSVSSDREETNRALMGLVAPKRLGDTATPSE